jgi:hypothetical protein
MAKNVKQGWQCPVCQTVYAPTVEKCECVKVPVQRYITYPYYPYYPYYPRPWWEVSPNWTASTTVDSGSTITITANEMNAMLQDGRASYTK